MSAVRIPINNVFGGGDYTAQIAIGSGKAPANVILDTGSSTLAVKPAAYDPGADTDKKPTSLAQDVLYGTGGWTGPVLETSVALGAEGQDVAIDACIALTDEQEPHNFGAADGILGLAYNQLNEAHDLKTYLEQQGVAGAVTYPWPFPVHNSGVAVRRFDRFLSRMPKQDLPPYFTALAEKGIERNKFALYTLRSMPRVASSTSSSSSSQQESPAPSIDTLAEDPWNRGYFILGGGEEETDLFDGEFLVVDVVDDVYYNTELLAVEVEGEGQVKVEPLPPEYAKSMISNSIVDSGTNSLVLSAEVFEAIFSSLEKWDAALARLAKAALEGQEVQADQLQLERWPDIVFTLRGEHDQGVSLRCAPSTYWQVDSPAAGQASFAISPTRELMSILGLPLMNNYYTVFDRTEDAYGVIRFAPIVQPPASSATSSAPAGA